MEDEDQLICYCFKVTKGTIIKAIQKHNLQTTDQVTRTVRAGGGCRTCLFDIEPLLAEYADPNRPPPLDEELNEIQIYNRSQGILDQHHLKSELETRGIRVSLDSIDGVNLFMNFNPIKPETQVTPEFVSWLEHIFRKKLHPHVTIKESTFK